MSPKLFKIELALNLSLPYHQAYLKKNFIKGKTYIDLILSEQNIL